MSKTRFFILFLIVSILSVCLIGCGKKSDSALVGKWAYIHDKENAVLILKDDCSAIYKGKSYDFEDDGSYITLKSSDEEKKMKYVIENEDMYLYETNVYTYAGEGTPDGVVGVWKNDQNKWEFEFTESGTFKEDTYFPGYYTVNEEDSSIKLMYNDQFEDTVIYYSITGNEITIQYPWRMVRMN